MKDSTPLTLVALIGVLCAAAPSASAQSPENLDYVMRAMFVGPEVKGVKIRGHTFNIKPAVIGVDGSKVTVKADISHTWKVVRDDQIKVRFTLVNGQIEGTPSIEIDEHGWKEAIDVVVVVGKAAKKLYDEWMKSQKTGSDVKQIIGRMEQAKKDLWDLGSKPDWKKVLNALVGEFVLRMGADGKDRLVALRSRDDGPPVTIFRHDTYRGDGLDLFTSSADVHGQGLGDAISSIRIPAGCTVTLYEHTGYKGESIRLTKDTPNFKSLKRGSKNWGDTVSSIRIARK